MMPRLKVTALLATLIVTACAPVGPPDVTLRRHSGEITLPGIKTFPPTRAPAPTRANASIAQEFIPLAFYLESGRKLPVLSRFEGPITLRVTGDGLSKVSERDLAQLLARLRDEARIPITRVPNTQRANITVQIVSRKTLNRAVPNAACFVAPRVESWSEYKAQRSSAKLDWTTITERTTVSIFLPGDVAPQEIRDCLHEEIAQSLGPVNDLYHLTDSIFNDDNFHTVLTGFDMVVLRAFYDPALHSGMSQAEVAARLPEILRRINPAGRSGGFYSTSPTPKAWVKEIEIALGAGKSKSARLNAAKNAVQIARTMRWNDNRLAFSLYALGRLSMAGNVNLALESFAEAESIYRADPNTRLHAAHIAVQASAFALSAGQTADAISIADTNSAIALKAQNANLLASLLMIKAQALDASGRRNQADIVRLDSLGWARYGFGSDAEIKRHLREIAALSPRKRRIAAR